MHKMQEIEQLSNVQGLPTDRNSLNKLMALHPGINSNLPNNSHHMVGRGALSGSAQAAFALTSYQNLLMRQSSMNSNPNSLPQEAASPFNNSNQSPSSTFQGSSAAGYMPGSIQNFSSNPHLQPSQQPSPQLQQQRSLSQNNMLQQSHPQQSQGNNPALQQQVIQQLLQEMSNNSGGSAGPVNGMVSRNGLGGTPSNVSGGGGVGGPTPSRSNSFKAAAAPSNSESSAGGGGGGNNNNSFNQSRGGQDLPQNIHLQDDIVPEIGNDFTDNGFFSGDLDDNIGGYGWKA